MSRTRRVFGKDFKAKVVLEALREKETLKVLAKTRA
jgi:transposase